MLSEVFSERTEYLTKGGKFRSDTIAENQRVNAGNLINVIEVIDAKVPAQTESTTQGMIGIHPHINSGTSFVIGKWRTDHIGQQRQVRQYAFFLSQLES